MKSIINSLLVYDIIGFDMDGTLYDEYEFISQAYLPVSEVLSQSLHYSKDVVYDLLCEKWLEFGSSANIFQIVTDQLVNESLSLDIIKQCVFAYRNASFELSLPRRSSFLLTTLNNRGKALFLVTDGDSGLQRKKFRKLGLENWFDASNVAISGDYGKNCQKPSTFMTERIGILSNNTKSVIYVGDREVDKQFADKAGFSFLKFDY